MNDRSPALDRYLSDMRRGRLRYAVVLTVIVVVLGAFVAIEWSRGEAAHASLHTVRTPPATLPVAPAAAVQHPAWRTTDRLGLGTPASAGTVVTYSTHTVRGRDARTGAPTWAYTRTDRTVCTAVQVAGTTIAVYAVHGNCDELSAFATSTGARQWTRTLDEDGMPLNGRPLYRWTSSVLLIASPSVIYALDPRGGGDLWTYARFGCRIGGVAVGGSGALISQTCTHPRCSGKQFCRSGAQLFLRSEASGTDKPNGDQMLWNLAGNADLPVSAGPVILAANRTTGELDLFDAKGSSTRSIVLRPGTSGDVVAADTADGSVVWAGGYAYAVTTLGGGARWTVPAPAAPSVVSAGVLDPPALAAARITAPSATGVIVVDGADGTARAVPVPGARTPTPTTRALPLGSGFLIADAAGITASR